MKKLIALLLALVMCLSLVACGGSSAPKQEEAPAEETAEEAPAEETGEEAAPAEEAAEEGAPAEEAAPAEETTDNSALDLSGKKVGIAMPTQSSERWINDGANMKSQLEALGAEVVLQYGEDDVQQQVSVFADHVA
jgi:putative multiple sugar transport system substrate-binding protein